MAQSTPSPLRLLRPCPWRGVSRRAGVGRVRSDDLLEQPVGSAYRLAEKTLRLRSKRERNRLASCLRGSVTGFGDFHGTTPILPSDGHGGIVYHRLQKGRESGKNRLSWREIKVFRSGFVTATEPALPPIGLQSSLRAAPCCSPNTSRRHPRDFDPAGRSPAGGEVNGGRCFRRRRRKDVHRTTHF